jgi:hypothetical protein
MNADKLNVRFLSAFIRGLSSPNGVYPLRYPSDRDGKSKTASAVDQEHYPEQHEVENLDPRDQGSSDNEDQNKAKKGGSVQH